MFYPVLYLCKRPAAKKILLIGIPSLLIAAMVYLIFFPFLKMALHLDFSQEYRKVKGENRILFWDSWSNKVYGRTFWGLCALGRGQDLQDDQRNDAQDSIGAHTQSGLRETDPEMLWLDTKVYDVSESDDCVVWYDVQENKIFLGNFAGKVKESFDTQYTVRQILLSPDTKYILYYEIEYGVHGGYSTDEEYCYYRVIDKESREQYTVYSGYREWYQVFWE